ncbi:MAG: NADH-quinone oxidoreductase subunit H, partial [Spiroplasma ixodetis]|nr:NADH-quinone oxidoreductase subunit H [Spiroplasma ixodetis]
FDFYESESELVSGFNVEMGSLIFIYVFIVEYLDMIFMLILTNLLFLRFFSWVSLVIMLLIILFILWIRGVFVRFRYDLMLINLWKSIIRGLILIIIVVLLVLVF